MNNWYNNESWYAPLENNDIPAAPEATKTAAAPAVKNKKTGRIAGIIVLAVLIIGGIIYRVLNTSFVFSYTNNGETTEFSSEDGDFNIFDIPGFSIVPADPDSDELPDNAKDFFENYYTSVNSDSANVNIEKIDSEITFDLVLEQADGEELTLQELYAKCAPSIVSIDTYKDGAEYGMGSGIIMSEDGLILTNTHVVDECDRAVVVMSDNTEYEAKLVGADAISDLAVLKIEASGLTPAVFGDSADLEVGDRVAAIGNPLSSSLRLTLTDGIISAIERGISYNGHSMTLLQTNAALNSGNSGGALFNMYGQVVGITNMKMSASAISGVATIEGIGFAIPSRTAEVVAEALIEDGLVKGRPSIGIVVGSIPAQAKEAYDLPDGLYISEVKEGSDAEEKGIVAGDVITAVNGNAVTSADEVNDIKNELQVGDTIVLTIWRNGILRDYEIILKDTNDIY